ERAGSGSGPVDSIVYRVADVLIQIRNFEFEGAGEAEIPALKAASQRLASREYSRSLLNALVQKQLLPVYYARGYLKAAFGTPEAQFDEAAATVSIRLEVKEGYEFHMGELEFRGLDNSLTAKLSNAWKIQPGDVYDSTYLSDYLPIAHKLLPPALDWDVSPHV